MGMFSTGSPNTHLPGMRGSSSGMGAGQMGGPGAMLEAHEREAYNQFQASQYGRRVRANDMVRTSPEYARFGQLDRRIEGEQDRLTGEGYREAARMEQARGFAQQALMAPYAKEVEATARARALGYDNAAQQTENNLSRQYGKDMQGSMLSGLAAMFAPFAPKGTTAAGIETLLSGLLDGTDINMRDNAGTPIGGVMSRFKRPASNTYAAS